MMERSNEHPPESKPVRFMEPAQLAPLPSPPKRAFRPVRNVPDSVFIGTERPASGSAREYLRDRISLALFLSILLSLYVFIL